MKSTEVLTPEAIAAMPDAELLLCMRRLRATIAYLSSKRSDRRSGGWERLPDRTVDVDSRLREVEAALEQVREEGKRRLVAAKGDAT